MEFDNGKSRTRWRNKSQYWQGWGPSTATEVKRHLRLHLGLPKPLVTKVRDSGEAPARSHTAWVGWHQYDEEARDGETIEKD